MRNSSQVNGKRTSWKSLSSPCSLRPVWVVLAWVLVGTAILRISDLTVSLAFPGQDKPVVESKGPAAEGEVPSEEMASIDPAQRVPPRPHMPPPAPARKAATPPPTKTQPPPASAQKPSPNPAEPAATPPPSSTTSAPAAGEAVKRAEHSAVPGAGVSFRLENADLLQFVNLVAAQLKMNYIVDPAVKGTVSITTMGELRREDLFPILQSVLEINGATAVKTDNFYRIVPLGRAAKLPLEVHTDTSGKDLPSDDRMMMEILPMRFVFAADMAKMLTPFLSDAGVVTVHDAGNVLILADTSLNVKRLMDIIEQFDSTSFAQQRIRLVAVHNNVASGLVPELESIFSAYALSAKSTPLRFVPIDRINSILVVTSDPSAFEEVQKWIDKLDQPTPPSGIQTFVYRVQNSEANYLARLLTAIRGQGGGTNITQNPNQLETPSGGGGNRQGGNTGSGLDLGRGQSGGLGGGMSAGGGLGQSQQGSSAGEVESGETLLGGVRITTDPVNNSLIIQCSAQQYADIVRTLKDLDVVPREVMIEARVYEVTLTGNLSFGVEYYLQHVSGQERKPLGSFTAKDALQASTGVLIGQTRELLGFLNASENRSRVRVLSAPTVLATDNSEAKIQVGSEIPILTSQAVVPVQSGGSSLFTNTIQNRDTGIILAVIPRITSTGLVSLKISQEISNVQSASSGGIQSPSFLKRMIQTQAVVGDNETIALGGLIQDSVTTSKNRIPLLGDIPAIGALFGSTSYDRTKTELIILLTPRIVKSVEEARDATRELRDSLKDLRRSYRNEKFFGPDRKPSPKN
jgi:general secretion pathway protein D